ncbi:MAG TPA: hypothetical protein VFE60_19230 [Roseiarcus sp.]|jgi:hypothetical protein|nr:hypothetical protein [Roseiarcus sp.]
MSPVFGWARDMAFGTQFWGANYAPDGDGVEAEPLCGVARTVSFFGV